MTRPASTIVLPPSLKIGEKIALVSTARKISKEELEPAIILLESWGLEVVLGKNLFQSHHQFAGTDQQRSEDLQQMMDDNNIKAILCVRGGYGTVRLMDQLDFSTFVKQPKWIAGFSDVTVLHSHINRLNISSLHSTMPISFANNTKEALESLRKGLFGQVDSIQINSHPLNRTGIATAPIVGGNLSILCSLLSSNSDIDTKDKILFLEDLDEYLYHIDRMMMALKRSGKLDPLKGLIIGGMTKMNDNNIPYGKTAHEIINEAVKEYHYPVCFNFPAGHIADNRTIILGQNIRLNVNQKTTIEYE